MRNDYVKIATRPAPLRINLSSRSHPLISNAPALPFPPRCAVTGAHIINMLQAISLEKPPSNNPHR